MFGRSYGPAVIVSSCLDESTVTLTDAGGTGPGATRAEAASISTPHQHARLRDEGQTSVTALRRFRPPDKLRAFIAVGSRPAQASGKSEGVKSMSSMPARRRCPRGGCSCRRWRPPRRRAASSPVCRASSSRRRRPGCTASSGRVLSARRGDSEFGQRARGGGGAGGELPGRGVAPRGPRPCRWASAPRCTGASAWSDPKSALISNDWVVGLNTTASLGAWTLTGEVYHESSHLGDEYGDRFDVDRLDWTREVASAWVSYGTGPLRVSGNLSYVLVDELDLDRPGAALGLDFRGRSLGSVLGGPLRAGRGRLLRRRGGHQLANQQLGQAGPGTRVRIQRAGTRDRPHRPRRVVHPAAVLPAGEPLPGRGAADGPLVMPPALSVWRVRRPDPPPCPGRSAGVTVFHGRTIASRGRSNGLTGHAIGLSLRPDFSTRHTRVLNRCQQRSYITHTTLWRTRDGDCYQGQARSQDPAARGPRGHLAGGGDGVHARRPLHPGHREGKAHPG